MSMATPKHHNVKIYNPTWIFLLNDPKNGCRMDFFFFFVYGSSKSISVDLTHLGVGMIFCPIVHRTCMSL